MGHAGTAALRKAHTTSIKALAWTTLVFALAVSAMLPNTFVGDWTQKLFDQIPSPWGPIVAIIAFLFLVVTAIVDVYVDWEPNRAAIMAILAMGVMGRMVGGGLAHWINQLSTSVLHLVDQTLFKAAPAGMGSTALAVGAAFLIILMSNRVISRKSRKG